MPQALSRPLAVHASPGAPSFETAATQAPRLARIQPRMPVVEERAEMPVAMPMAHSAPTVIYFSCPGCGSGLSVPTAMAAQGITGPCPYCQMVISPPRPCGESRFRLIAAAPVVSPLVPPPVSTETPAPASTRQERYKPDRLKAMLFKPGTQMPSHRPAS